MNNMNDQWYRPDGRPAISGEERMWAIAAHLSAIVAMVVSAGWLSFLGPLLIYVAKKDSSPYVRQAAAQSLNFNVGVWLMSIVGWIFIITVIGIPIGIILIAISFILTVWHHVKATLAASNDRPYYYPFQIKLLS